MPLRTRNITGWILRRLLVSVAIASASAQPYAYVANLSGNNVTVVNTATNTSVTTISVSTSPSGLAVTPDGAYVYVACQGANVVSVISAASNSVVATIPVGTTPIQVAISPNGAQAYVVNRGSTNVSVIDIASRTVVGTIGVGSRPVGVAFNPSGSRAYVPNLWSLNVSIIDTASKTVINTFPTPSGPNAVGVAPNGNVYVSNGNAGTVTVHDSNGNQIGTISGFISPDWIAITPSGNRLVVANGNGSSVSMVDTSSNSVFATVPTGTIPTSVAITPDGARAYVTNEYSLSLSVIDLASNSIIKNMAYIGAYPFGVAIQPPAASQQLPPPCSFSLSQSSASFGSSGGPGSVNVTAPAGCGWSVSNALSWVHIQSGASGTGNGTVSYTVDANLNAAQQSGSMTIAGMGYSIAESGLACSYSLSAGSTSLGSGAVGGSVNITAGAGCGWQSGTDSPSWLTISSGFSGSGSGTVGFSATANGGTTSRTGHLTIGGQNNTVTQSGTAFSTIRVRCGGATITDASGVWSSDNATNYSVTNSSIANAATQALYQTDTWSTGTLQYVFPVPNGSFTVTLKFAEFYLTAAGHRVFNIVVNGTTYYANFDILAHVAANTAYDVSIPVTVSGGQITIQLVPVTGSPKLNALQITTP